MNIYLRIELLGRELQGRLLLGLAAAERGHDAVLLDKATAITLNETLPGSLPPGYFHDNSPGQDGGKTILHESLASQGWQITGQDEEHGLTTDDFQSDMALRFPRRAMANKSAMFSFGEFDGQGIRRACPEYADRVVVTGSPRVDFWRRDFSDYFALHPHPLGPNPARHVLFVMSWTPFANELPRISFERATNSDELLRRVKDLRKDGLTQRQVDAYRLVVETKTAVEDAARQHPDVAMIYRPHPHELLEAWEHVFRDAPPNVKVVRDSAVSPWIRNARCVVALGSTVAFESAISGTPTVSFQPRGFNGTPAASRMGHRAVTPEDVVRAVAAILAGEEPDLPPKRLDAMQRTIAERFFALEGRLAADRIVDEWERLADASVKDARPALPTDLQQRRMFRASPRKAVKGTLARLGLEPEGQRRRRLHDEAVRALKFPEFNLEEVRCIHAALIGSLGRFSKVRITPVGPRALHLTAR